MNVFELNGYQFHYYICRKPTQNAISLCFVPLVDTENHFQKRQEKPQKITYELYNSLEDNLGKELSFKPLFSTELNFFEIEVLPIHQNLEEVSYTLRENLGGK